MPQRVTGAKGSTDMAGRSRAGGANAHSEGTGTIADGDNAHAEGTNTTASSPNSHAEGGGTTASGQYGHAEGSNTTASGFASHAQGASSVAAGTNAHAEGSWASAPRSGQHAQGGGSFSVAGDLQVSKVMLAAVTSNASPSVMAYAASGISATAVVGITTNRAYRFRADVVARRTDVVGEFGGWTITGTLVRATGNARFIGAPAVVADLDAAAAAWTCVPTAAVIDATTHYLALTVTGEAAKTIYWVASVEFTEVG